MMLIVASAFESSRAQTFKSVIFVKYFVYILYSENHDTYYKGQTSDLTKRLERHNSGSE
uniref:GIY-YIG nuclease family protein n=1 Tax=Aestuariivivens insulae TaxID=1621988 RepID=UPI00374DA6BB